MFATATNVLVIVGISTSAVWAVSYFVLMWQIREYLPPVLRSPVKLGSLQMLQESWRVFRLAWQTPATRRLARFVAGAGICAAIPATVVVVLTLMRTFGHKF
jgi:hypothetical protein